MGTVQRLTDDNFVRAAKLDSYNHPVLVHFAAPSTFQYRIMAAILAHLAENRSDIKIVEIDVTNNDPNKPNPNPITFDTYRTPVTPLLYLFRNGEISAFCTGGAPPEAISQWIDISLQRPLDGNLDHKTCAEIVRKEIARWESRTILTLFAGMTVVLTGKAAKLASGATLIGLSEGEPLKMTFGAATLATEFTDFFKATTPAKQRYQLFYDLCAVSIPMNSAFLLFIMAKSAENPSLQTGLNTLSAFSLLCATFNFLNIGRTPRFRPPPNQTPPPPPPSP